MTLSHFKKYLNHLVGCVNFDYNGYSCGVDPIGRNQYDVWYGNNVITVNSVEDVLNTKIFNGESLLDIWDDLTNFDY